MKRQERSPIDMEKLEKDLMRLSKKELVKIVAMQKIGLFNPIIPYVPFIEEQIKHIDVPFREVPNAGGFVLEESSSSWIPEVQYSMYYGVSGCGN